MSTNERQEDFQMIFDGLKEKVLSLFDHVMQPKVLVCDAAQSISNAFIAVFGTTPVVRMCWTHAKKNMQQKVQKLVNNKTKQKEIIQDIDALHNATSIMKFLMLHHRLLLKNCRLKPSSFTTSKKNG